MKYLKLYESLCEISSLQDVLKKLDPYIFNTHNLFVVNKDICDLKGIEKFTNLVHLSCSHNYLSNLKGIENCTNLQFLDCRHNKLSNLKGIEQLKKLETFYCGYNYLKNLDELMGLQNLEKLDCYGGNIWFHFLPKKLEKISKVCYTIENMFDFKSYESQKALLEKYPERIEDLKKVGIHEKIKKEFPDLVEGSEFGFFNLQ